MVELMRGPGTFRQVFADFMQAELPALIDVARTQWGKQDHELPYPVTYDSYDPLVAHDYPTIGAYVNRTTNWAQNDLTDAAEQVYSATYNVLVFVWVCTPVNPTDETHPDDPKTAAMACRDDMLSLMRSLLLAHPSMNSGGVVVMNERTMSEDYLDPMRVSQESPLWLCGGTISFDVKVSEHVYIPILGVVNTHDLTVDDNPQG